MNRNLMLVLAAVLFFVLISTSPVFSADGEKNHIRGLGFFGGEQIGEHSVNSFIWRRSGDHQWRYFALQPVYGWKLSRRWDFFLEGNIGWLRFDSKNNYPRDKTDILALEGSVMTSFDLIRIKDLSLFAEAGVGLGYWSKSPNRKLIQPNLLGIVKYGIGLKIPLGNDFYLKSNLRFAHNSSLPSRDSGVNTNGFMVSIVKYL